MNPRAIAVSAALGTSLVAGGWVLGRGLHVREADFSSARLFDTVLGHVRQFYVDSIADSTLFEHAVVGMLRELNDPYTLYLPPNRLRRLTEQASGNYIGIGAGIQRRGDYSMIIAPIPGSPAERAGLRTGDLVVEIDGQSARGLTTDEVIRALRGPPESAVTVVIERPGDPDRLTFRLTRSGVHRRAVGRTALLAGNVGYVDINTFNDSTAIELRKAIDSLRIAGMRSLVLDLRGNPGGVLAQGVGVADVGEAARDSGRDPDEVAVAEPADRLLGAVLDVVDGDLELTFEDEEDLFDVVMGMLGSDGAGGQAHVGEGEVFRRQGPAVVLVIARGARSDVADLGALEAVTASSGLETQCVPVLVAGLTAGDAGVDLLLEVGDGLLWCGHGGSSRCSAGSDGRGYAGRSSGQDVWAIASISTVAP